VADQMWQVAQRFPLLPKGFSQPLSNASIVESYLSSEEDGEKRNDLKVFPTLHVVKKGISIMIRINYVVNIDTHSQ